jgi:proteic killer suppression protein
MEVRFKDVGLDQLETDPQATAGYPQGVVSKFRSRVQLIRAAVDERDFYQLKSLHFEKLKGVRAHQYSMRLNDQYRLILEIDGTAPNKTVIIISIEDYH